MEQPELPVETQSQNCQNKTTATEFNEIQIGGWAPALEFLTGHLTVGCENDISGTFSDGLDAAGTVTSD